jgi:hypothetical protein
LHRIKDGANIPELRCLIFWFGIELTALKLKILIATNLNDLSACLLRQTQESEG